MGLFGRKKKVLDASGEAVAERIALRLLRFQRRLADRLNEKVRFCNRSNFLALLLLLGLGFGLYCLWLVSALFR